MISKDILGVVLGCGALITIGVVVIIVIVVLAVLKNDSNGSFSSSSSITSQQAIEMIYPDKQSNEESNNPPVLVNGSVDTKLLEGEYIPTYYSDLGIIEDFWAKNIYGQGVKVLVIDSGTNKNHPDVKDVIETNTNVEEDVHGTHVAGIIGGEINGKGMVGVAPLCELYIWDMGRGYDSEITPAFDWAINHGIQVINMSFGSEYDDNIFHQKVRACRNAGIFLIAAAGNETSDQLIFPAAYDECIAVVSVNSEGKLSWFSNFDPTTADVCAYGEDIKAANADFHNNNDLLLELTGTSMSTPFVTGLTALIIERERLKGNTNISNQQMITFLNEYLPPMPQSRF